MSSSLRRVLRNLSRVGIKEYFKQMNRNGDTKYGTLIGTDSLGNKFYENKTEDEIHMRTRWVEYSQYYADMSRVEPGWRYWLGYGVDTPFNQIAESAKGHEVVPKVADYGNKTGTTAAYIPYSTVRPYNESVTWQARTAERE